MIRTLILLHHLEDARGDLVARRLWDHPRPGCFQNDNWFETVALADALIARLRGVRAADSFRDRPPLPDSPAGG